MGFRRRRPQWIRFYADLLENETLQSLPPHLFKIWVNLACAANENKARGVIPPLEDAAWVVREDVLVLARAIADLRTAGLILETEGGLRVSDWPRMSGQETGRPAAPEWRELRNAVFARDNYTCRYCGAHGVRLECDHVVPLSRGGTNGMDNLVTACLRCNRSKGSKNLGEWEGAGCHVAG